MTTKAAHTPGPWFANPSGKNWWITTANGLDETVSCMAGTDPEGWPRAANAHLIAAAPDILASLEAIYSESLSWHTMHGHTKDSAKCDSICALIPQMRESIYKARGIATKEVSRA